jgi:hypothetical protein
MLYEPLEITWEDFSKWAPDLAKNGLMVGVNWSGKRVTGYDVEPEELVWVSTYRRNFLLLGVDHNPRQRPPDCGPPGAIDLGVARWMCCKPSNRHKEKTMNTARLEEIQAAIESLPYQEYIRLRQWFSERDWEEWDRQIEAGSESGKLDFLIEEALNEKAKGILLDEQIKNERSRAIINIL